MSAAEDARPVRLESAGRTLVLDADDVARIERASRGALGTRRSVAYLRARYKYPDVPEPIAMELAGAALGMEGSRLRTLLSGAGQPLLRPARVTIDGQEHTVGEAELEGLDQALSTGTWKIASVYFAMKSRTRSVDASLALTAELLGHTVAQVKSALEWHEQYIRWHDGDPSYSVL